MLSVSDLEQAAILGFLLDILLDNLGSGQTPYAMVLFRTREMARTKKFGPGNLASKSRALVDLSKLVNNQDLSNVSFLCQDNKLVFADKALLAARCDHFHRLLFGSAMKEVAQEQIHLPDVQSSHLQAVFEFLYTGAICLSSWPDPEYIIGVYELSRRYCIDDLKDELLLETMTGSLQVDQVGEYLRMAAQVITDSLSSKGCQVFLAIDMLNGETSQGFYQQVYIDPAIIAEKLPSFVYQIYEAR